MNAQLPENRIAEHKDDDRPDPEIRGLKAPLKKPSVSVNGIPVSGHDIIHGIDPEQPADVLKAADIKHDGNGPDAKLQRNIHDLGHIPEENDHRAGRVYESQNKYKHAEIVIWQLDQKDTGKIAVESRDDEGYKHKEQVDEQR
jgi:hypothetical protein